MTDDKTVSLKEVLAEIDAMPPVKAEGHEFIEKTCLKTRVGLLPSVQPEPCATGYIGIEDDYSVSVKQVLNITAETGALTTQMRVRELPRYAQPVDKDINVTDNDTISRQAALHALRDAENHAFNSYYKGLIKAHKIIAELPSAQTDPDEWCRDCKEYDKERHSCPRWNKVIRHTVEDLKAEQPERKEGAWVLREDLYGSTEAKCSECGFEMLVNEEGNGLHEVSDLHYCPNCGADMRQKGADHAD